jgi:hypothetical protein
MMYLAFTVVPKHLITVDEALGIKERLHHLLCPHVRTLTLIDPGLAFSSHGLDWQWHCWQFIGSFLNFCQWDRAHQGWRTCGLLSLQRVLVVRGLAASCCQSADRWGGGGQINKPSGKRNTVAIKKKIFFMQLLQESKRCILYSMSPGYKEICLVHGWIVCDICIPEVLSLNS